MIIEEHLSIYIYFRNGDPVLLHDNDVVSASIRHQCCPDGNFDIGGVFAAALSITCKVPGTNSFRLRGAKIVISSKFQNEPGYLKRGVFWITDAKKLSGDIYSITGLDNIGWFDTSSMNYSDDQNRIFDSVARYFEGQGTGYKLHGWADAIVNFTRSLVERVTGLPMDFKFSYDEARDGHYKNFNLTNQAGENLGEPTYFLVTEVGSGLSDSPRTILQYLAQIAGGFFYAKPDGDIALKWFGALTETEQQNLTEITPEFIEQDSCEMADFRVHMLSTCVQSRIMDGVDVSVWTSFLPDASLSPFRVHVKDNPFIDGFTAVYIRGGLGYEKLTDNLWPFTNNLFLNWCDIRPFRCKVHMPKRFSVGQKVKILLPGGAESLETVLTSVTWTFRGGYELSCSGEDSRTMSDALRMSKADKALKETQSRCAALEKKKADKP